MIAVNPNVNPMFIAAAADDVLSDDQKSVALTARAEIDLSAAAEADQTEPLPRFRMVAYTGEAMRLAGWRHPVVIDLAGLSVPSQNRPIRFGHDAQAGVGHTDAIGVDGGQLVASGVISRDTAAAKEVVASSRNGFPWQASVGASVDEFEFVRPNQTVTVNGREFTGPVNVVRRSTLGEISFVDLGADGRTSATIAASAGAESAGDDDSLRTDPDAGGGPDLVAQMRAEAAAETERINAVRRICAGEHRDLEARAIREGWDATRCELEVLRASRPKAPAAHVPTNLVTDGVLQAACMLSGRIQQPERFCEEQDLDAASKRFGQTLGLQELLLEAAWANGYSGRTFRDWSAVMDAAFGRGIEAAGSTVSIGGILSNVANKFLLDGFNSVERTWRNIAAIRSVTDFKTVTS